jgi:hypothetical protein
LFGKGRKRGAKPAVDGRSTREGKDRSAPARKILFEALEPRILLSADPLMAALSDAVREDVEVEQEPSILVETIEGWSRPGSSERDITQSPATGRSEIEADPDAGEWSDWDVELGSMEGSDAPSMEGEADGSRDIPAVVEAPDAATSAELSTAAVTQSASSEEEGDRAAAPADPVAIESEDLEATDAYIARSDLPDVNRKDPATGPGTSAQVEAQDVVRDSLARGPPSLDAQSAQARNSFNSSDVADAAPKSDAANDLGAFSAQEFVSLFEGVLDRWFGGDQTPDLLDRLDRVSFRIVDLDGDTLSRIQGTEILIDSTAAGQGWFVDQSLWEYGEFGSTGDAG